MTRWATLIPRMGGAALLVAAVAFDPAAAAAPRGPAGPSVLARASPEAASTASAAPGLVSGSDSITVLGQSEWVESSGDFRLQLAIRAHDAGTEQLVVEANGRLRTRTAFDDALAGHYDTSAVYQPPAVPLSSLAQDQNGGVDVNIPVNQTSGTGDLPEFSALGDSGVFPVEIFLVNAAGVPQGQAVTTFLVFAAGTAKQTGLPSLSVAVVLPVHAAPAVDRKGALTAVPAAASSALSGLVSALAYYPDVPISLAVTPQTLDALGSGSTTDKSTLGELASLARDGPDLVLPATYASVSLSGMVASGLTGELSQQIQTGSSGLAAGLLGAPPSPATWVVDQALDQPTLDALRASGAKRLIVPASELSPLPSGYQQFTFAYPSTLTGAGAPLPVYGADSRLTADFTSPGGPALAASQLLAEMAMIQLETPGYTRGVAVLPPEGWDADPVFVRTLLAGLNGDPLLRAVTASQLFSVPAPAPPVDRTLGSGATALGPASVPASTPAATISPEVAASQATEQLTKVAGTVQNDRRNLQGLASMLVGSAPATVRLGALDRQLLTAESTDVAAADRAALLKVVNDQTSRMLSGISLPAASITLTSTKGQIPLTVLADPGLRATVQLRLSSQRLIFRPFSPHCQIPLPTVENCTISLTAQNTTLKVPVETRSSGVFPLNVALWSPDGSVRLVGHRLTVRSTAVSGVGIVLIVLAVLSLAVWWGRDLHHGRRARQLVPAPVDEGTGDGSAGDGSAGDGSAGGDDHDPSPAAGSPIPAASRGPAHFRARQPAGTRPAADRPVARHFRSPPEPPV